MGTSIYVYSVYCCVPALWKNCSSLGGCIKGGLAMMEGDLLQQKTEGTMLWPLRQYTHIYHSTLKLNCTYTSFQSIHHTGLEMTTQRDQFPPSSAPPNEQVADTLSCHCFLPPEPTGSRARGGSPDRAIRPDASRPASISPLSSQCLEEQSHPSPALNLGRGPVRNIFRKHPHGGEGGI